MAPNNTYLQEAVSDVRQLTEEEKIRQRCQAREDYYLWERINKRLHEKELAELNEALQQKDAQLTAALARITELEAIKNE